MRRFGVRQHADRREPIGQPGPLLVAQIADAVPDVAELRLDPVEPRLELIARLTEGEMHTELAGVVPRPAPTPNQSGDAGTPRIDHHGVAGAACNRRNTYGFHRRFLLSGIGQGSGCFPQRRPHQFWLLVLTMHVGSVERNPLE